MYSNTAVTETKEPRLEPIILSPEDQIKVGKIMQRPDLKPLTKSKAIHRLCGMCRCGNIPTMKLIYDMDGAIVIEKYCAKCWERKQETDKELDMIKSQIDIVDSVKDLADGINTDKWGPNFNQQKKSYVDRIRTRTQKEIDRSNLSKKSKYRIKKYVD